MTAEEIAWLAGLLEGEGFFGTIRSRVKKKVYLYPRVGVAMTDRDVVERVANLFDNAVYTIQPHPSSHQKKVCYRAILSGKKAAELMRVLRPHMGARRREQIDKALGIDNVREDPNIARRAWSKAAAANRKRDALGQFVT